MDVGTDPVAIGTGPLLIKNLGPDLVYLGDSAVDENNGFPLAIGESVAVLYTNRGGYAVSEGTSDVRHLTGGTGIFPAPPTPAA